MTPSIDNDRSRLARALLLLASVCLLMIRWKWDSFPPDLSALYMAAYFYGQGQFDLIYATPQPFFDGTPEAWLPYLPALGFAQEIPLPYVYPPLWAALAAPLVAITTPAACFQIIGSILIASIAGSVFLAWRLAEKFAIPLWAWIMLSAVLLGTSVISFVAVMHLQVQIFVIFLTLLAFERYGKGFSATAGLVLGFAAMLKLAPAGFILIFLLDRNWRALAAFGVFCAVVGAASLGIAGLDLHHQFRDSIADASSGLFVCAVSVSANVLLHAIGSLVGLTETLDFAGRNVFIAEPALIVKAANKLLLIAALLWMLRRTQDLSEDRKLLVRLFSLSLLINAFGPLGWMHYYMLQLFLLPAILSLMPRGQAIVLLVGFSAVMSWPIMVSLRWVFQGDIPHAMVSISMMLLLFAAVTRGQPTENRTYPAPQPA